MTEATTPRVKRRPPLHGEPKKRRSVHLTDPQWSYLEEAARRNESSRSEVVAKYANALGANQRQAHTMLTGPDGVPLVVRDEDWRAIESAAAGERLTPTEWMLRAAVRAAEGKGA